MNSKLNEQGPDRILLCSDEVLAKAVWITDPHGFDDDGSFEYGMGDGGGDSWGYEYGGGTGHGDGDGLGSEWGLG